jgi:anti-sigma factor RsiW
MKSTRDADLMALADGELDERTARELEGQLAKDPIARGKLDAIGELGEIVRSHLELSADAVPQRKLDALWREIDKGIERQHAPASDSAPARDAAPAPAGFWRRIGRWFDHYRGHVITGAVSAGAVAALALVLRGPDLTDSGVRPGGREPIDTSPVNHRPAEIESLDTPDGTGTVFNLEDEDGSTTVIWVTPDDTVEGI